MFLDVECYEFYHLLTLFHDTVLVKDCISWAVIFICRIGGRYARIRV